MAKCLFLPWGALPCQYANYSRVTEVDLCLWGCFCLLNTWTVDVYVGMLHTQQAMVRTLALGRTKRMQLKPRACKDQAVWFPQTDV